MKQNVHKNCGSYYEITAECKGRPYIILVDAEDYELVSPYQWSISPNHGTAYALTRVNGKILTMHKLLLKPQPGLYCDHINRDGLDNRRQNLRTAKPVENIVNASSYRHKRIPYKNIYQTGQNRYKIQLRSLKPQYFDGPIQSQHIELANKMRVQAYGEFAYIDTFKGDCK